MRADNNIVVFGLLVALSDEATAQLFLSFSEPLFKILHRRFLGFQSGLKIAGIIGIVFLIIIAFFTFLFASFFLRIFSLVPNPLVGTQGPSPEGPGLLHFL